MQRLDSKAVYLFFLQNSLVLVLLALVLWFSVCVIVLMALEFEVIVILILTCLALILSLASAYLWAVLTYNNYKYELTDDGFKKEHGVIIKKYTTIPYEKIQNIDIHRGILARMLGLSDLQIQTAGLSGYMPGSMHTGAFAEGRLPGLSMQKAEELRSELVKRSRHNI